MTHQRPDRNTTPRPGRWAALGLLLAAGGPARGGEASLLGPGDAVALDALPANERAVSGLVLVEGALYGTTTGRAGHLFSFDPRTRAVRDLHRLDGGVGFSFGIAVLGGALFAGTQRDPTGLGREPRPEALGRLVRLDLEGGRARASDLGVAVAGQGIHAVAASPASGEVVGLTVPDGHFFAVEIASGTARDLGAIAGHRPHETDAPRQVARAVVLAADGSLFASGKDGAIHRYDPRARSLTPTAARLPALPGREPWASLDAAALAADGSIYGGTSDGYLFRFDPRSETVVNLGKPIRQGGFDGMVLLPSGVLHAVAGERLGTPREVAYDTVRGGFRLGGIPRAGAERSLAGFGAIAGDGSGTIYAGELDRIARLVIYRVP